MSRVLEDIARGKTAKRTYKTNVQNLMFVNSSFIKESKKTEK